jgi:O-acetyl-ADP-ribose deacetylase
MNSPQSPNPMFEVVVGDITKFAADVIVNSAHESLAPGGGVSGAIHRAAGPGLARECAAIVEERGWLEAGEAVITGAYELPARFVVHAVAPRYADLGAGAHKSLSLAYQHSIELAVEAGAKSIVFPSLGTGIFGFPIDRAPAYAMDGILAAFGRKPSIERISVCCIDIDTANSYLSCIISDDINRVV